MNFLNYTIKQHATAAQVSEMIALDNESYEGKDQGVYKTCQSWYKKNNNIYTILLLNNKVIGYINFVPLTEQAYERFLRLELDDSGLCESDIEKYEANKAYSFLIMSVVVGLEHRHGQAIKLLTNGFRQKLQWLQSQNITITRVLADCVSKEGEAYISRLGLQKLKKTNRQSVLYQKVDVKAFNANQHGQTNNALF